MLNEMCLLAVLLGFALIAWSLGEHFLCGREGYEFSSTPSYRLRRGLYRYTRNPMYVAALLIWIGWSFFYGSVLLAIASAIIWLNLEFIIIPFEERRLAERFGESYLAYKAIVARWIGYSRWASNQPFRRQTE